MKRRIVKILLALVLAVGVVASVSPTNASATPLSDAAAGWAYLPVGSGTPLASGVLSDSAGGPIAGATLVLSAEPIDGSDAVALSRAASSSSGAWSVSLPAGTNLKPYTDPASKMVNFRVESFDGTTTSTYFLSAAAIVSLSAYRTQMPDAQSGGEASLDGQTMTLATDPARASGVAMAAEAVDSVVDTTIPCCKTVCTDSTVAHYYNIKTWIGATFNEVVAPAGSAVHFYHFAGSSSSLGVGFSVSGGFGSFSFSGTRSSSSTTSASFPVFADHRYIDYFGYTNYDRIKHTCKGASHTTYSYYLRPAGWTGGHTYQNRGGVTMGYCTRVGAHIVSNQAVSRAYDFTVGVSTSSIIGINLSAQTGYSSGTEINFDAGNYGHPWCGRNGYPGNSSGGTPQLLTMHATRL